MLSVALTGNVASGKSRVAQLWADAGVPVVSADELARDVVEPGTEGFRAVVAAFGDRVLAEDGRLDRQTLRDEVFRDAEARSRLESILHPRIRELRELWIEDQRRRGASLVVSEIPLLFETGYDSEFDQTVLVHAPQSVRLDRLVRLRGLGEDEAKRIMQSQMDAREKLVMADHVIVNDGDLEQLANAADELLSELRRRAGRPV